MNAKLIAIVTLLLGVSLGAGYAYMGVRDPGPDFEFLKVQPFTPYEAPVVSVAANSESDNPGTSDGGNSGAVDATTSVDPQPLDEPSKDELPLAVLNGEEYDFGVMEEGERRSHTFILKNNTKEDIALKVLETTCKCTVVADDEFEDAILPGQEGKIKLEWKPLMLQPDFRQSATIATSCSEREEIVLSVFGKVKQTLIANPRDIAFSDVSFRSSRESELVIQALQDPNFEILEHSWVNEEIAEFFTYKPIEATDEHRAFDEDALVTRAGLVQLRSGLPLGPFRQVLRLKTNMSKSGLIEIPVRGRVVGDIMLAGSNFVESRNTLRLGAVEKSLGTKAKMRMTVKGPHAKKFEITGFRTVPESLEVSVVTKTPLKDGLVMLMVLNVEVPVGADPGNYTGGELYEMGKVFVKTNHPDLPEVAFDVEFAVTD